MTPDRTTVQLVLEGVAEAAAWGEVGWSWLNGSWRGRVESCSSKLDGIVLAH